jgi:hypothetical protein
MTRGTWPSASLRGHSQGGVPLTLRAAYRINTYPVDRIGVLAYSHTGTYQVTCLVERPTPGNNG